MSHLAYVLFASGTARRPEHAKPELDANVSRFLEEKLAAASRAWPTLSLDAEDFVTHLARHLPEAPFDATGKPTKAVEQLVFLDLFLTAACLRGDTAAIAILHREHLAQVPLFVARVMRGLDKSAVDDLVQAVAEKLLVSKGDRPARLADYAGQGPLGGWIRVVSTRMALRVIKKGDDLAPEGDAPEVPVGKEPELDHLRVNYKERFKAAFEAAFQKLDKEQRLLLRLHSSGTVRGDDMARMLGIDRSTAMRKLARAREVLFDATRDALMAEAGISSNEFRSIARAVQSQIDVTLSRVLQTKP